MRPFRFAVMVNHSLAVPGSAQEWRTFCRRAEAHGYSSILLSDHLWPQLAPVPALVSAAEATDRIRVGTLMFGNDYRHPVMLAKEMATADLLTDGRLEVGLGAGWKQTDYVEAGFTLDSPAVRIRRLAESITVLKGLWGSKDPFSFDGEFYQVQEHVAQPKPFQSPHPPLIVGGGGRSVLTLAAQQASVVSINRSLSAGAVGSRAHSNSSATATDQKLQWVRQAAGPRIADIELNMVVPEVRLTTHRSRVARELAPVYGVTPEEVLQVAHLWVGTVEQICADLFARRDRWGVSYLAVVAKDMDRLAPVVAAMTGR